MQAYTCKQPKDGDQVLLCDHVMSGGSLPCHFFNMPPLHFVRPDSTEGDATWIVICDDCYKKYPNPSFKDLMLNIVRADATWKGNEPEIKIDPTMN